MSKIFGFGCLPLICFAAACSEDDPERLIQPVISTGMVISQVYGAGGNPGASYKKDYVELFNRGASPVNIGNWSVQYGSDTGNFNLKVDIPAGTTVQSNHYFLITLGGGSTGATVPSPDLVGSGAGAFNISGADGKFALVSNTTALGCGIASNRCNPASFIDLVGYGDVSDYETAAASSPVGATGAIHRGSGGCTETDDNSNDFSPALAAPRNSGSPQRSCTADLGPADLSDPPDLAEDVDLFGFDLRNTQPDTGGPVVISQFYGSGGETGARYRNDYVELFNRTSADADIGGWSLQYASKDNTFALKVDIPDGSAIPAGGYFLIRLSSGGGTGMTLPEPDLTVNSPDVLNISGSAGKLALVSTGNLQVCGTAGNRCTGPAIIDKVGYGAASDYETAAAGTFLGNTHALFRKQGGCVDTDHNTNDFESLTAAPRNSSSPANLCSLGPAINPDLASVDAAPDDGAIADQDLGSQEEADLRTASPRDLSGVVTEIDLSIPGRTLDFATQPSRAESGCSCDLATGSTPSGAAWIFALCAVAYLRRARRMR
jgi:hypothetical protein